MSISENSTDLAGSTATKGWVNVSGYVYGHVNPYTDSDWYKTYLLAGVNYKIQMTGDGLDSYLVLRNSTGAAISYADTGDASAMETLDYRPSASGYYFIDAQSYRDSIYNTGFYLVFLESNVADDFQADPNTESNLQIGQIKNATLENAGDADWHRLALNAGQTCNIRLSGALANASLKVFDANGIEASSSASGNLSFTASNTAAYYVEVSGLYLTDSGSYSLSVITPPRISISNGNLFEGDTGTTLMEFTLSLSAANSSATSVRVDTADDTALEGVDYQGVHRVFSIPAGATSIKVNVPIIGNTGFQANRAFALNLSSAQNAAIGESGYGYIYDDDQPADLDLPSDSLIGFQWYLYTVRAIYAWEKATGTGIKVGVFDQGIDATNPDLRVNTNTAAGRNALNLSSGGAPATADDNHGTWVAGVIGAARDGVGVVGVAYNAQLVPIYSSLSSSIAEYVPEITNAFVYAKTLDVLNNSWGFGNLLFSNTNWAFLDNARSALFAPAFAALKDLASTGRNNLGTVVVQSAGNSYSVGDDTNLHNFQNSRYIITVGATDYFGEISPFSTNGASVLVSAPGGGGGTNANSILTTDRTGTSGGDPGNYKYVDGTSFSSPVVAGVVALMLQVNPKLGYRDIQQILAYTAQQIDTGIGTWRINGASDWNGGGLHYNALDHASGFGQVDALAAVRLAAAWDATAKTVANTKEIVVSKTANLAIPDNNQNGISSQIVVNESMRVERVDVTINITHSYIGDLSILLRSPSGVVSFLLYRPAKGALSAYGSSQEDINFTFDTVLSWGENSAGSWQLSVFDNAGLSVGTLNHWTLDLVGAPASNNKTVYYTNEFGKFVAQDPSRAIFSDPGGGLDTINAAAMGLDNRIDLSGASASVLNGTPLTIAKGTTVVQAVGGDGDDVLIANNLGNTLRGMVGNDDLKGGNGNDVLEGGSGDDLISGGLGTDTVVYSGLKASYALTPTQNGFVIASTAEGRDTVTNVESARFSDQTVALTVQTNGGKSLVGTPANDFFSDSSSLDENIDGAAGIDTVIYSSASAYCTLKNTVTGWTVGPPVGIGNISSRGTDTLINIERLQFSDKSVALDISGNAGQVYRLYQAAFNRMPDKGGLGDWIYGMDNGMTLLDVSAGFVGSAEFKSVYGQNPTNAEVVTRFYQNVLHRDPEQGGYDYWMNQLQSGLQTRTQVLTGFSESPENQTQVIGVIQNGIEYTPHGL